MSVTWVPGDGWGLVGEGVVGWLSPQWGPDAVRESYRRLGEFWELAGALEDAATGPYALLGFGLTATPDREVTQPAGRLTVVAAGVRVCAASATDELRLAGSVDAPSQGELARVTTVEVGTGAEPHFPVDGGIVACGGLCWTASDAVLGEPVDSGSPPSAPDGGDAKPVPTSSTSAPSPASTEVNPFVGMWGHTTALSVEAAAVRAVPEPAAPAKPADPAKPAEPAKASEPEFTPPKIAPAPELTLVGRLDDDPDASGFGLAVIGATRVRITGTVVIGRSPSALLGEECALLRVKSPERGISRNHAVLRVLAGSVVASDLASNNGTRLRSPGRPDVELTTIPVPVHDGDVLDLGEGVEVMLIGLP